MDFYFIAIGDAFAVLQTESAAFHRIDAVRLRLRQLDGQLWKFETNGHDRG